MKKKKKQECKEKDGLDTLSAFLNKKTIIIMPCSFGTGHKTAANALKEHIADAGACEDYRSHRL